MAFGPGFIRAKWNLSTSVDSLITHKDCGVDLDQDTGCQVRQNPVIPKS